MNLGTEEDLQYLQSNANISPQHASEAKALFREYKNLYAWTYKDLKGISPSIAQHKIELEKDIPRAHQAKYRMKRRYCEQIAPGQIHSTRGGCHLVITHFYCA